MIKTLLRLKRVYRTSANEIFVFCCILKSQQRESEDIKISNETISRETTISKSTVKQCIRNLNHKRLIHNAFKDHQRIIRINIKEIELYTGVNIYNLRRVLTPDEGQKKSINVKIVSLIKASFKKRRKLYKEDIAPPKDLPLKEVVRGKRRFFGLKTDWVENNPPQLNGELNLPKSAPLEQKGGVEKDPKDPLTPKNKKDLATILDNNNVLRVYNINIYTIYYYCAQKRNEISEKYFHKKENQQLTLVKAKEIAKALKVALKTCEENGHTLKEETIIRIIDQKHKIFDHTKRSHSNLFPYFYLPTLLKPQKVVEHIETLGQIPKDPWYRSIGIAMQQEMNTGGNLRGMHHREKKKVRLANEIAGEEAHNYYASMYYMPPDIN